MMDPQQHPKQKQKHRVALVCNFFYPRLGGVEMHIWSLANCLLRLGHKVIIITHAYSCPKPSNDTSSPQHSRPIRESKRTGVRYLPGPIKVYYCPILPMVDEASVPTFCVTYPLLRWIFIREQIELVHSHQATSTLGHESLAYAMELGLGNVYTDHSLFGFDDVASVVLNKALKVHFSNVDSFICVSHTCRENLILRASLDPKTVHVIPNAVDVSKFIPDPSQRPNDRINVVIVSRLVYRKGVDLLVGTIPLVCRALPNVHFIVGGDGAKKLALEEMVEREHLQDRVELLGAVPHNKVRSVLIRGHVFLNCSLTESFCIALLEASSCGLFCVSTNVGGVPEVLPPDMAYLADPSVESLSRGVIHTIKNGLYKIDPINFHDRVAGMYSWDRVARETVEVYNDVLSQPRLTLLERLDRYLTAGPFVGAFGCLVILTLHFWSLVVNWWQPIALIDIVPDLYPAKQKKRRKYPTEATKAKGVKT